jgi:hypothetical protein
VGTPWIATLVDRIAPSPHPRAERSVTPKTPPGGSRGMGSGDSIPIGERAVGPPRSGFVLRLCIRKADEARGEAALDDGLADTRFCRERNRFAVGKTVISFASGRPQQLVPSTRTSLLACTHALRRAILQRGYTWRQARPLSSRRGRRVLFPKRALYPSIQSTLKSKRCAHRGFVLRLCIRKADEAWGEARARPRPCGYKILQMTHSVTLGKDESWEGSTQGN